MKKLTILLVLAALIVAPLVLASPGKGYQRNGNQFLEKFDTNNDGAVTQAEIYEVRGAKFDKYDANGDGELSLDEFKTMWTETKNQRMFNRYQRHDTNSDNSLSREEFLEKSHRMMSRMDRDRDHQINSNEMGKNCRGGYGERHGRWN